MVASDENGASPLSESTPARGAPLTPDYGLDAPRSVRNTAIAGVLGLGLWVAIKTGLWAGRIPLSWGSHRAVLEVAPVARSVWLTCVLVGPYLVWTGKVGKLRARERLLDHVRWIGTERVLDVGCGRGLMLVGAARRAVRGRVIGIDVWHPADLTGNRPDATLENARREGVADRVSVETADMRALPFANASFDVVVSSAAIHNLPDHAARATAIGEIVRVLVPGGTAVIEDIRHVGAYEQEMRNRGVADIRRSGSALLRWILTAMTMGMLRPGVLVARKSV